MTDNGEKTRAGGKRGARKRGDTRRSDIRITRRKVTIREEMVRLLRESTFVDTEPQDRGPTKNYNKVVKEPEVRDACLVMIHGASLGRRYNLVNEGTILVGRNDDCGIQMEEDEVSRRHCEVTCSGNRYVIRDLGSTNGTYVNDVLVGERDIHDGDQVQIGGSIFKFISSANIEIAYHEEIYCLSTTDGLTQVHNKRFLLEYLDREISRCRRQSSILSLILLDIDHFKKVNDVFGHLAGDQVLKHLTTLVRANIRHEDVLARFGGEEFMIVLPQIDQAGALLCAEKIHQLVARHKFASEGANIPITISLGVVTSTTETETAAQLISAADKQLYRAKDKGRNCVCGPED